MHFAPVRSDDAAPETSTGLFLSLPTSLTASAMPEFDEVDDDVDLVDVDPGVGEARGDVRLVLVIAEDDLDLHALGGRD